MNILWENGQILQLTREKKEKVFQFLGKLEVDRQNINDYVIITQLTDCAQAVWLKSATAKKFNM